MNAGDKTPKWIKVALAAAGVYNLAWGAITVLFPDALFRWTAVAPPRYPQIWQCVGMIVGVYGIGYLIAARNPFRHWPIVLVGLLGKIFGPIGFLSAAASGDLPWSWGVTIVTNDLIWWMPLVAILYLAFRFHTDTAMDQDSLDFQTAVSTIESQRGATLAELSAKFLLRKGKVILSSLPQTVADQPDYIGLVCAPQAKRLSARNVVSG